MIIDTHTHVLSSDKFKHPLDPGERPMPQATAGGQVPALGNPILED